MVLDVKTVWGRFQQTSFVWAEKKKKRKRRCPTAGLKYFLCKWRHTFCSCLFETALGRWKLKATKNAEWYDSRALLVYECGILSVILFRVTEMSPDATWPVCSSCASWPNGAGFIAKSAINILRCKSIARELYCIVLYEVLYCVVLYSSGNGSLFHAERIVKRGVVSMTPGAMVYAIISIVVVAVVIVMVRLPYVSQVMNEAFLFSNRTGVAVFSPVLLIGVVF